jgi:hypothetical protein
MPKSPESFLDEVPPQAEIRQRLAANLAERSALRTLLKISEQRDAARSRRQLQESTGAQK